MLGYCPMRRWLSPAVLVFTTFLAVACQDARSPTGVNQTLASLRVTADLRGEPIATLVVTVTAADIPGALVYNLTVANGVASGTIKMPPGSARTITVTAMDSEGSITHEGSVTLDVGPGQNAPVQVKLGPKSGQVPITVTFGAYGVVISPPLDTIGVGDTLRMAASVTDADGNPVPTAVVAWATSNPSVVTVSDSGVVTGLALGTATIVATYEGVAGMSTVTIWGGHGGFFVTVSVGVNHTCGLTAAGVAYCWGYNFYGQLGDSSGIDHSLPTPVAENQNQLYTTLSTGGGNHTCGLALGGLAFCWGSNAYGELGDGTLSNRWTPSIVDEGALFTGVYAGVHHTCGTSWGLTRCWGLGEQGQLGDGHTVNRNLPVSVSGGLSFASLAPGFTHTCGLTPAGVAYCWGSNNDGELGDGSQVSDSVPVRVSGDLTFAALTAGRHTCGLTLAGVAYCWGDNSYGQLGTGDTISHATPVQVAGGLTFTSLRAGSVHTCGITQSGAAYCWGFNGFGQLGDGSVIDHSLPTPVAGNLLFATLSPGGNHTCGITQAGAAYCWGYNHYGQLGNGSIIDRHVPALVATS